MNKFILYLHRREGEGLLKYRIIKNYFNNFIRINIIILHTKAIIEISQKLRLTGEIHYQCKVFIRRKRKKQIIDISGLIGHDHVIEYVENYVKQISVKKTRKSRIVEI